MTTIKRRVKVYLDMAPMEMSDGVPYGVASILSGDYVPSLYLEGSIRNVVEVEVQVPVRNEVVVLPMAEAKEEGVTP